MYIRSFALPLIAAATMFTALAQNAMMPSPRVSSFPPVGLGSSETAVISVVNLATDTTTSKASCTGTISFVNASGVTIGAATTYTVTAGQIFSAKLPFASSGGASPRAEIRGVVQVNAITTSPRPPCSAQFTMETYDTATSATHTLQTMSVQEPVSFGFRN
jgi:hypothetical protein